MDLETVREVVRANKVAGRNTYEGLTTDEISRYNRALMFGDNDEAFPGEDEWSRVVD